MFRRTLVLWLALVSGNSALADKPPLSEEAAMQLFFDTGYTFCDARLLKEAWGLQMEYGAKVRTGRYLDLPRGRNRVARYVADTRLASGRGSNGCSTWEIGLDYTHISTLEAVWGTSTGETKTRVEQEFAANRWRGVRDKIDFNVGLTKLGYYDKTGSGYDYDPGVDGLGDSRDFYALDDTPFTYCDAERVARVWGVSTDAAVARLQTKTASSEKRDLLASAQAVRDATPTYKCSYYPDFSYSDAARVSSMWVMPVIDVKARLADKLTGGYATYLMHDLGYRTTAWLPDTDGGTNVFFTDLNEAAFNAQGFTACDAHMLASLWAVTDAEALDRAGRKLLDPGQISALDAHRADSHRLAGTNGFDCEFDDSFTAEQLTLMATHWGVSEDEARSHALDKLRHGDSQEYLREAITWQ